MMKRLSFSGSVDFLFVFIDLRDKSNHAFNTVNCVGIMGRGIALQFKSAYPDSFKAYAAAC
jgi:hypothetical protein